VIEGRDRLVRRDQPVRSAADTQTHGVGAETATGHQPHIYASKPRAHLQMTLRCPPAHRVVRRIATALSPICFVAALSSPQRLDALPLVAAPSFDSVPVLVDTGSVIYNIPRNYILYPDPSYPILRITYPGFSPLNPESRSCLERKRSDCDSIELRIQGNGSSAANRTSSAIILRNLLRSSPHLVVDHDPLGYRVYSVGSRLNEILIYSKLYERRRILFHCILAYAPRIDPSVCDDMVFLSDGNVVRFFFRRNEIPDLPRIEDGILKLMDRFRLPKGKQ
jgi:hypothetical protein